MAAEAPIAAPVALRLPDPIERAWRKDADDLAARVRVAEGELRRVQQVARIPGERCRPRLRTPTVRV